MVFYNEKAESWAYEMNIQGRYVAGFNYPTREAADIAENEALEGLLKEAVEHQLKMFPKGRAA